MGIELANLIQKSQKPNSQIQNQNKSTAAKQINGFSHHNNGNKIAQNQGPSIVYTSPLRQTATNSNINSNSPLNSKKVLQMSTQNFQNVPIISNQKNSNNPNNN